MKPSSETDEREWLKETFHLRSVLNWEVFGTRCNTATSKKMPIYQVQKEKKPTTRMIYQKQEPRWKPSVTTQRGQRQDREVYNTLFTSHFIPGESQILPPWNPVIEQNTRLSLWFMPSKIPDVVPVSIFSLINWCLPLSI